MKLRVTLTATREIDIEQDLYPFGMPPKKELLLEYEKAALENPDDHIALCPILTASAVEIEP